jgi:hypothetical protein
MTVSDNHDEYAAAAANNGGSMKPFLKALSAAVAAGGTGVVATLPDGITAGEWVTVGVGAAVAAIATFYVPYQTTVKPPAA